MSVTEYEDFTLADGIYPQPDGILSVTSDPAGQWVRFDANPPVLLDPIGAACIALVLEGKLSVSWEQGRGLVFQTTATGRARVEAAVRRGGFAKGLDS